jgi:hypothetical protein
VQTYRRSFARLCAGTVGTIVGDLGSSASGQLLDAGCWTANVARVTAGLGWAVVAVDVDAQMLEVGLVDSLQDCPCGGSGRLCRARTACGQGMIKTGSVSTYGDGCPPSRPTACAFSDPPP